jgi:preprotein translocase subunit SecF
VSATTSVSGDGAPTLAKASPPRRLVDVGRRIYRGETRFDFVRRRRWWYTASSVVILAGAISLATRGLNYSIDFVGGTQWQVASSSLTVAQAESVASAAGLSGATVEQLASGSSRTISVQAKLGKGSSVPSEAATAKISNALATAAHVPSTAVTVDQVGPSWGGQITHKAIEALIVFFFVIAAYISIFFEWKMAASAIIAVIHDILVTVGIYSLTGFQVTPDTVVAFLTILGYSLYDTIVVFDRVRDNTNGLGATGKLSYTDVVNLSMNQTLARSINTSLVAIMPILAVLVLGADILGAVTLQYFGLALFIGLTSGAYSSIFIASPLLATLKEREPRYVSIRDRLEARGTTQLLLTPAAVAAGALASDEPRVRSRRSGAAAGSSRAGGGRPAAKRGPAVAPRSGGNLLPGSAAKGDGAAVDNGDVDADEADFDSADELLQVDDGNGAKPAPAPTGGRPAGARPAAGRPTAGAGSGGTAKPGGGARGGGNQRGNGNRPSGSGAPRPAPRPRKKGKRR